MKTARFLETIRRLRPSQAAHRLRLRATRDRTDAAAPSGWGRIAERLRPFTSGRTPVGKPPWVGVARLPAESRRPTTPPYDGPLPNGRRFAGAVARRVEGGALAFDPGPPAPSLLARWHAGYAEHVRALAEAGDLAAARDGIAFAVAAAPGDPYVRARRVLSLIEAAALGVDGAAAQAADDAAALAIAREWDVRGNHLLCDGAALYRAGHAFGGALATTWRTLGAATLSACARDQVLADGVHFERSPVYQAIALEHLLIACETAAAAGHAPPPGVEDAARRLAASLHDLLLPDGEPPRWRDGAPGAALPWSALFEWAERRVGPVPPRRRTSRSFPAAGLEVVRTPDGRSSATLIATEPCPRELPAHGHADALAFEAVIDRVRVVASSGTASYAPGADRDRDRLPGAFAGLRIDGRAPADPYDAFRVGARGFVRDVERGTSGGCSWAAATASFSRRGDRALVRRTVAIAPGPVLVVVDEIAARGEREVVRFVPLLPGIDAKTKGEVGVLAGAGGSWRITAPEADVLTEGGAYATGPASSVPRTVLRIGWRGRAPERLLMVLTPGLSRVAARATPVAGGEVRIEVARPEGLVTMFVPAGRAP